MVWGWRLWGLCGFIRLYRPEIHLLRCPLSRDHARVLSCWVGGQDTTNHARISFYAPWPTLHVKATDSVPISTNYSAGRAGRDNGGGSSNQHMCSVPISTVFAEGHPCICRVDTVRWHTYAVPRADNYTYGRLLRTAFDSVLSRVATRRHEI